MGLLREFWNDELGAILSAEMVSVGTVAVLGTTVGLGALRDSLNDELVDVAKAVRSLDQSYSIQGVSNGSAWTAGSSYMQRPVAESVASIGVSAKNPEAGTPVAPPASKATKTYDSTPLELVPRVYVAPSEPVTVTPAEKKLNPTGTTKKN